MKLNRLFSPLAALTLLLAMLSSVTTAWADDLQLTVYGSSTSTSDDIPYTFYWDEFTRSQYVIPKSELTDMKLGTISAITLYAETSFSQPYVTDSEADVYLKEVDYTSISSFETKTKDDIVFQGKLTFVPDGSGSKVTITFSKPFVYSGDKNLLIGFDNTTDDGYRGIYFYGIYISGSSVSGYHESSLDAVEPSQKNFIPRTTFTYTAGNGSPKLTVRNITQSSATLAVAGGSGTYNVQYALASANNWTDVAVNSTQKTFTLIGLSMLTNYKVRAQCVVDGGDNSPWREVAFSTTDGTQTLTVYDGKSTQYTCPYIYSWDEYSKSQYIIPKEDLTSMAGATVSAITLYTSNSFAEAYVTESEADVYLMEVANSTFSDPYSFVAKTNDDIVYKGKLLFFADGNHGKVTITFSKDFTYSGDNLLIGFDNTTNAGFKEINFYGKLVDGAGVYGSSKTSPVAVEADVIPFIPKTTFTYLPATNCQMPKLSADGISHNAATLKVSGGSGTYNIQYALASADSWTNVAVGSGETVFNLSGLTAQTAYKVRVQSVCSAEESSEWRLVYFSTTLVAPSVGDSWSDDFEGSTCDWTLVNGTMTNQWTWGSAASCNGTKGLYVSNDGGSNNAYTNSDYTTIYAAKALNFAEGKYLFSYNWRANGENTFDYLRVALVPATHSFAASAYVPTGYTNKNLPEGWIALDGGNGLNLKTVWQHKEAMADVSGTYYVVFAWRNDNENGTLPAAIDDVSITRISSTLEATNVAVTDGSVTTTSATVTWTGSATQWQVEYGTDANFLGATQATASTNSYTMSGLQSSTVYYFRVRAIGNGPGPWSSIVSFKTEQAAISTFPWIENFNTLSSAGSIPAFWNNSDGTTTVATYKWCYKDQSQGTTVTSGVDNSKCIRFNSFNNQSGKTNFLKTPPFALPADRPLMLSFWYRNPTGGDLSVYISTDGGQTYTTALATGLTDKSTWTEMKIPLKDYKGEKNVVFVFGGTSNYANGDAYIYLDNVAVEGMPLTLTLAATPTDAGTVEIVNPDYTKITDNGDGTYEVVGGTEITIKANPCTLYRFSKWSDNVFGATRTFTMSDDMTFTAVFESKPTNTEAISYIDEYGVTKSKNPGEVYLLDGSETQIGVAGEETWYYCDGVTFTNNLTLQGDVVFIINGTSSNINYVIDSAVDDNYKSIYDFTLFNHADDALLTIDNIYAKNLTLCGNTQVNSTVDIINNVNIYRGTVSIDAINSNSGDVNVYGGKVVTDEINTPDTKSVTLGWTNDDDYIKCANYTTGAVTTATGKRFVAYDVTGSGNNITETATGIISGAVDTDDNGYYPAIYRKKLKPIISNFVSVPNAVAVTWPGDDTSSSPDFYIGDTDYHVYKGTATEAITVGLQYNEILPNNMNSVYWTITGGTLCDYDYFSGINGAHVNADNSNASFTWNQTADASVSTDFRPYAMPGGYCGALNTDLEQLWWYISTIQSRNVLFIDGDATTVSLQDNLDNVWSEYNPDMAVFLNPIYGPSNGNFELNSIIAVVVNPNMLGTFKGNSNTTVKPKVCPSVISPGSNASGWVTYCHNYPIGYNVDGCDVYTIEGLTTAGDAVVLGDKVSVVMPGVPYLINASTNFTLGYNPPSVRETFATDFLSTDGSTYEFRGNGTDGYATENLWALGTSTEWQSYVLRDGNFVMVDAVGTGIPANRCWLNVAKSRASQVRSFTIATDGGATAVSPVNSCASAADGTPWYTLDGRKLTARPTTKGVYLNGNKKVIVR